MSLDIQQIDHLAKLARLSLSEEEKKIYASQLEGVFAYFQKLQELETTGIEPINQIIPLENIFCADDVVNYSEENQQKIIDNAPDKSGRHIKVKKIL